MRSEYAVICFRDEGTRLFLAPVTKEMPSGEDDSTGLAMLVRAANVALDLVTEYDQDPEMRRLGLKDTWKLERFIPFAVMSDLECLATCGWLLARQLTRRDALVRILGQF
ncbi:hypothetical protein BH09SUM1_BH09SUM1_21270 [soil metagenome]